MKSILPMIVLKADHSHALELARVHINGWKAAYGGTVEQAYLESLCVETRAKEWETWLSSGESETLIATIEGKIVGFLTTGRTKTPPPGSSPIRPLHAAEIYALYIDSAFWRRGVGAKLLQTAAQSLKERKQSSLCLWVLDANTRAKAFYQAMGAQKLGSKMVTIGPSTVKETCYGWRDTSCLLTDNNAS